MDHGHNLRKRSLESCTKIVRTVSIVKGPSMKFKDHVLMCIDPLPGLLLKVTDHFEHCGAF